MRSMLRPSAGKGVMAGFVQVIEFTTSRMDEIRALVQEMRDQPIGLAVRGTFTADRDRPGTYINIIEFASREAATANSQRPETQEFATKMTELCEGPGEVLQPRPARDLAGVGTASPLAPRASFPSSQ